MAAHTPGPWIAAKGYEDDPHRCVVLRAEPPHYLVAVVENGAPGDTLETEEHTALLLAAAFELADALEEVLSAFHRCGSPADINPDDFLPDTITSRALAALAKAGRLP